jgi:hypothetical protein
VKIRVIVPDAFAASDLAWHLGEAARVGRGRAGAHTVDVDAGEDVAGVMAEIRTWMKAREIGAVTVHIGDAQDVLGPDDE